MKSKGVVMVLALVMFVLVPLIGRSAPPVPDSELQEHKVVRPVRTVGMCDADYMFIKHVDKCEYPEMPNPSDYESTEALEQARNDWHEAFEACSEQNHQYWGNFCNYFYRDLIGHFIDGKFVTDTYSCRFRDAFPSGNPCPAGSHLIRISDVYYECRSNSDALIPYKDMVCTVDGFERWYDGDPHDPAGMLSYGCWKDMGPHICGFGNDEVHDYFYSDREACCIKLEPPEVANGIPPKPHTQKPDENLLKLRMNPKEHMPSRIKNIMPK